MKRRGRRALDDLDQELRDHIVRETEDNIARGLPPDEARRQALIKIGNPTLIAEDTRSVWVLRWLDDLRRDLSYAFHPGRFLWSQRSYALLVTSSLSLSVGASVVAVGVGKAFFGEPVGIKEPSRVVMILGERKGEGVGTSEDSFWTPRGLQRQFGDVRAFEDVAGQVATSGVNGDFMPRVEFPGGLGLVEAAGVTWNYFAVLGVQLAGRGFTQQDDQAGADPVAIISDRLWHQAFNGRPETVGATTESLPVGLRIVGVAPRGFHGLKLGEHLDVWLPQATIARFAPLSSGPPPLLAFARLRSGVSPIGAEHELIALARGGVRDRVVPIGQIFGSPQHRTTVLNEANALEVLGGMAILTLLAGCATIMALIIVHYERRGREFGIRLALGASLGHVLRQVIGELVMLACIGTAGAVLVGILGLRALPAVSLPAGADLSRLDFSVDWRLVGVAALLSAICMIAAAAIPTLKVYRVRVGFGSGTPLARRGSSLALRRAALGIHTAATVVLLVGASLMLRTIHEALSTGAGFDLEHTLFLKTQVLPIMASATDADERRERLAEAARRLTERLANLPGIESVALGDAPIGPDQESGVRVPHAVETGSQIASLPVGVRSVDANYTAVLGLPLVAGRSFNQSEIKLSPLLGNSDLSRTAVTGALVSRAFANRLWDNDAALGKLFRLDGTEYAVVGVVGNCAEGSMRIEERNAVYLPTNMAIDGPVHVAVVARTRGVASRMVEDVNQAVTDLVPVGRNVSVQSGRDLVAADLARQQLAMWFFSTFGVVALALGTGSSFGLVAYFVESKRHESGVRMALGCTPASLLRMFVLSGSRPSVIGALAGLAPAVAMSSIIRGMLIGISSTDLAAYLAPEVLVVTTSVTAGVFAALGAIRHSPVEVLRSE